MRDASENETDFATRIVSVLDRAGRAWAKRRADALSQEIEAAGPGIMRAAGLDPPASDSLSPQWASEFRASSEKKFLLNFYDTLGLALLRIATGYPVELDMFRDRSMFPEADSYSIPAARGTAEGRKGAVSGAEHSGVEISTEAAHANELKGGLDRMEPRAWRTPGESLRRETLAAGTKITIGGLPFWLPRDTQIEGIDANFRLAGIS